MTAPPPLRIGLHADDPIQKGPFDTRRTLLNRIRQGGLDHLFVADHVSFHTGRGMDGLIQAATLAALDPQLAVHVGVYLLALRHPVPVARQIAQICESAPGRLHLGIGVGGEDRHEVEICGVDPRTRGRRTDAALEALHGLLSGEPTTCHDAFFDFDAAQIQPAPNPAVPIVIGGRSDAALRRAARLGDGWLGVWCSPRRYAQVLAEIETLAETRTRPRPAAWDHGLQVWVGLDANRDRARERLAQEMHALYRLPFEPFARYCPAGSPEEVAEFLAPYLEVGCRHLNVMAVAESTEASIDGVVEIAARLRDG